MYVTIYDLGNVIDTTDGYWPAEVATFCADGAKWDVEDHLSWLLHGLDTGHVVRPQAGRQTVFLVVGGFNDGSTSASLHTVTDHDITSWKGLESAPVSALVTTWPPKVKR